MRKTLVIAAAVVLLPSTALAEEKEKPGVAESLGAAAGSALGYTAGAAGGPLGSAVGGLVGQSIGKGLVGGVKKLLGGGDDEKAAEPRGPGPATLAEMSPPAPGEGAPASLADLEGAGGAPDAAAAGAEAAAETSVGAPALEPADAATLNQAPPEFVPTPESSPPIGDQRIVSGSGG